MGLPQFHHELPPQTDHWRAIVGMHDDLTRYGRIEQAGLSDLERRLQGPVTPGVDRTLWEGSPRDGVDPGASIFGVNNLSVWRGFRRIPGLRIGMIEVVDSGHVTGKIMGLLFGQPKPETDGYPDPAILPENISHTRHRILYLAWRLGSIVGGRAYVKELLFDASEVQPEPDSWQGLKAKVQDMFTGNTPASREDHAELRSVMAEGVASKSAPPEWHPEA